MTLDIRGLAQVAVSVTDLDRAVAFYRDALGLRFLFSAPPRLAFLQAGDVRLMLEEGTSDRASHPFLFFRVASCREASAALAERGVSLLAEPHVIARLPGDVEVWLAHFEDPDGHLHGLMSEEAASGAVGES